MQVVQSGQSFPFDYAAFDFATNLVVRALVWRWNTTTNLWDFVTYVDMSHVGNGLYAGQITGEDGKTYLIQKLVYTDLTHTALDPNRSQGTESVQCVDLTAASTAGGLAYLSTASDLVGTVDLDNELVGVVQECD